METTAHILTSESCDGAQPLLLCSRPASRKLTGSLVPCGGEVEGKVAAQSRVLPAPVQVMVAVYQRVKKALDDHLTGRQ